ncbi:26s proteasome regulatory subunit rpn2 [Ophiostoma piceae UAMH 11346]|uniref:26S proteasome regulatory subunit RPN2 n=1 Tax=Ophiostoma piceae (strain UAMH 11346) TaxID=1262450 RepID=S3D526_OPHP1|nr:26s proteasome regulatory subunit rpn2 [Ophiostoma piceae UAMH 11346]
MPSLITATGVLGFLADEEPELKVFALNTLNDDIDTVWTEVAGAVSQIEALYEDEDFPERELAALVLAKVYYHLQAYSESMTFALAAGDLFKIDSPGEFEETIISKCIDQYIATCLSDNSRAAKAARSDLPAIDTASSFGGIDASSIMSPTTPFSQSTLPSKSLLSRDSVDNTIYDPSFEPATGKDGRQGSVIELTDSKTKQALGQIIERIFSNCLREGHYRQVVGIAIEAKNLAVLRRVIKRAADDAKAVKGKAVSDELGGQAPTDDLMEYVLGVCMDIVQERKFRTQLLDLILHLLNDIPQPDYFAIAKCVVYLNASDNASTLLRDLVDAEDREHLAIAYQIAFDLYDNGTQEFLGKVIADLPDPEAEAEKAKAYRDETEKARKAAEAAAGEGEGEGESEPLLSDDKAVDPKEAGIDVLTPELAKAYTNIREILDGSKTIKLNVEFLYRNNHADISILKRVRDSLEGRNSIFHTAVTFCNAFMHAGTTHDKFFRDNLDWLSKAVNWSKFTATAALGVIHRGNISQAKKLLEPYMPREGRLSSGSSFSQGGALYAYGLIHANHGAKVIPELHQMFSASDDEHIMHGGALGLGIAGMASGNEAVFESLTNSLHSDSALSGEAVGLAMGLIMLGTGNAEAIRTMFTYAHETSHEKIVRGCALGIALVMYGRQESADGMIEALLSDPDPTLRYGGILTVALAYCGTGSNKAIRKLLHTAVSDTSDDVRRIAVMSLGFILFRKPGSVPRMVELLSESYNPHVRYGSAMALGISCAGTGLDEAIDLLEPMMKDPTDFVRQGALIALSMIMVQQNEAMNPKVASIRKTLKKVVGDRHEDAMTKFGAALALGIIDAGGRNCTIGLQTQTGNLNMAGIVGMAVFTQYWYWFPFTHFLSLSFSPTSIIGLDQDLDIPSFKFHSATRPSLFDYPPEQEVKAEEGPALIATAILSTTAQAKRRAQKKERATRTPLAAVGEKMDIDEDKKDEDKDKAEKDDEKKEDDKDDKDDKEDKEDKEDKDDKDDKDDKEDKDEKKKKKAEKEKVGYEILNMSRVLPGQLKYISFPATRYRAVKKPTGGPLVLLDTQPDEPKELIEEKLKKVTIEKAPVAGQTAGGSSSARRGAPAAPDAEALRNLSNALRQSSTGATSAASSARNLQALTDFLSGGSGAGGSRNARLSELFGSSGEGHRLAAEVVAEAARAAQLAGDEDDEDTDDQGRRANDDGTSDPVLMALDDEADEDDEAPAPSSFDYYTDAEDDE